MLCAKTAGYLLDRELVSLRTAKATRRRDSRIGFGTGGYPDNNNTCGNAAGIHPDNVYKRLRHGINPGAITKSRPTYHHHHHHHHHHQHHHHRHRRRRHHHHHQFKDCIASKSVQL